MRSQQGHQETLIHMSEEFVPQAKETTMVTIAVTGREAHLIRILRKYPYGKIIITKMDNKIMRVEVQESIVITEHGGVYLDVNKVVSNNV